MPSTVTLAPIDLAPATRIGRHTYRKQLLRKVPIDYPMPDGSVRKVVFDDAYLADLAESFNAGAYDLAPFILADEANRHTLAPERYRGELKAVEVTEDGLDGILELTPDAAELVERTGRRLGVSPRIKDLVQHVDGRKFKRAIHHVLGTLDGRMQGPTHGLSPWQPIDLSDNDPNTIVLDLSSARYQEDKMARPAGLEHLTDEDYDTLTSLAAANNIDLSAEGDGDDEPGAEVEPGDDEQGDEPGGDDDPDGSGITQDELDALIDAELDAFAIDGVDDAGELVGAGADVSLSAEDDGDDGANATDLDAILARRAAAGTTDLANGDHEPDEAAELRVQLAREQYGQAGVPPWMIDLAAPVLALPAGDDTLDLASPLDGQHVDVRTIVSQLLDAAKGTVDLSREDGYDHEQGDGTEVSPTAQAWLDSLENDGIIAGSH